MIHPLGYYWRERTRPIRAAVALLVKHGGTVAHTSGSGSVYVDLPSLDYLGRNAPVRVRVSNHALPMTAQRADAHAQGNRAASVEVIIGEEWRWAKPILMEADTITAQVAFALECAEG
tara:strand:- start:744 stop:1097 length:354 start_codon:yes stop_codon:yes gene_type:complete